MSDRDFLAEKVFPYLDAVDANLLDDLKPQSRSSTGAYTLDCPECHKSKRAFYFPGGPITCHRKNHCKGSQGISVWAYLSSKGDSKTEIFEKLCSAVGVVPENSQFVPTPDSVFKKTTRALFSPKEQVVADFLESRKLTIDKAAQIDLGFYPNSKYMLKAFESSNLDINECMRLGFISHPQDSNEKNNCYQMAGRIIGYWPQPDGSLGYWGYSKTETPKYLFSSDIKKDRPYKFYQAFRVNITEGTLDADSCILSGIRCSAIGQASLRDVQARYLKDNGVSEVNHIIDTDIAGMKGGLKTTTNALSEGVLPYITFLGHNADDSDQVRRNGDIEHLHSSIDKAMPGYLFAALLYLKSMNESPVFDLKLEIDREVSKWPSHYQDKYKEQINLLGFKEDSVQLKLKSLLNQVENRSIPENELTIELDSLIKSIKNG